MKATPGNATAGNLVEDARSRTLRAVILFLMAAQVAMLAAALARGLETTVFFERLPVASLLAAGAGQLVLLRRGHRELVAWILTGTMTALYCAVVFTGSVRSLAFTAMLPVPLIFSILIGRRWSTPLIGAVLLSVVAARVFPNADSLSLPPVSIMVNTLIIIGLFLLIADRLTRLLESAVERVQSDAGRMRALNADLEKALAERDEAEGLRLEAERALQDRRRHESLGIMAAGMAHDFNNIVQGILMGSEVALHSRSLDERATRSLESIRDSALALGSRCRRLQEFAGERRFRPQPVSPAECVRKAVRLYEGVRPESVRLETRIAEDMPEIEIDPEAIQDVLVNLMKNAGEAMADDSGRIEVGAEAVECDAATLARNLSRVSLIPGPYVRVRVTDTGAGMDEFTLSRVFEPFYTTKAKGHGLGLASAMGTLREHRAGLIVTTAVGRGSTFELLFPVAGRNAACRTGRPESPSVARPSRP